MEKFNFENLRTYNEALVFVELIYLLTKSWPKDEQFGLTSQFRRAAVSIMLNIAEGSSRTKKDFRHFIDLSRGSIYECVAILQLAVKLGYISSEQYSNQYKTLQQIAKMIQGLKRSLEP